MSSPTSERRNDVARTSAERARACRERKRRGQTLFTATILADQVLEIRTRNGQLHLIRREKIKDCVRRYAASGCAKAASNCSSAQSISPRVISRGGLTRMVWSWVSLHRTPRRRRASQ